MATRNWYAWINLMPPKPDDFHVKGEVLVPNPGVQAELTVREPQGINRELLLLDLHAIQRPGMWPQVMTWVQARYDLIMPPLSPQYSEVEIFLDGMSVAKTAVDKIQ